MLHALAQFGAESSTSGIGALGVNVQALVIQLITFIIVIWVIIRFAVKPMMKVLNDRRAKIEDGLQLGDQMQKDKAELEAKVEKTLHEARQQADKIIADAHDAGRQTVQEAEDEAKRKAEATMKQAETRIEQDIARARKRLEKDVAGWVADATEAVVNEKVDARKDSQLINRALERSKA
jgi:F-type H+-transporting ATPase subunit b